MIRGPAALKEYSSSTINRTAFRLKSSETRTLQKTVASMAGPRLDPRRSPSSIRTWRTSPIHTWASLLNDVPFNAAFFRCLLESASPGPSQFLPPFLGVRRSCAVAVGRVCSDRLLLAETVGRLALRSASRRFCSPPLEIARKRICSTGWQHKLPDFYRKSPSPAISTLGELRSGATCKADHREVRYVGSVKGRRPLARTPFPGSSVGRASGC